MKKATSLCLLASVLLAAPALSQTPGFSTVVEFTGTAGLKVGGGPTAALMEHSDGNLYGTTFSGGTANVGTFFKLTKAGAFTSLRALTGNTGLYPGFHPSCILAENSDGSLYGMNGGNNQIGVVGLGNTFKITIAGAYTPFFSFAGQGSGPGVNRGALPYAGFTKVGADFYGTTNAGGAFTNHGTLLKMSATGTNAYLLDFTSQGASNRGAQPWGHLLNGNDGYLYGTTYAGGDQGIGTVFKYHVVSGVLTTLVSFSNASSPAPGKYPAAKLLLASDGNLYGTTANGGAFNAGVVFRVNPTTGAYAALVEFSNNTGASQGAGPFGGLVQGPDGFIYGTTEYLGPNTNGNGTVFRMSLTGQFTPKLVEFTGTAAPHKGGHPFGDLMKTTEGIIYGTTVEGGADNQGTIWKLDTSMLPQAPVVTTGAATSVNSAGATLNGVINPKSLATSWQFEYGTTTAYGNSIPVSAGNLAAGTTDQPVNTVLGGLSNNTLYHYRLKAISTGGLSTGADGTFTTGAGSPQPPVVVTGAASNVTVNSAVLNGTVNPQGDASAWQFEYGLNNSYGSAVPIAAETTGSGSSAVPVNISVTNLPAGTLIHYRLKATNDGGTTNGTDQTFTTSGTPLPPSVVTGAATEITGTGAVLNGTVNPRGGANTVWRFEYGPNPTFGSFVPVTPQALGNGITPQDVSIPLTGFTPGTTVYYRLLAKNDNNPNFVTGSNGSFVTATPPVVVTKPAIGISNTEATMEGTVNPNGSASSWQFEYGPDTNYGALAPVLPGSTGTGTSAEGVTTKLENLAPGTTIHYRLTATNGAGTSNGLDFTFTTKQPPAVTTTTQNLTATGVTLSGTVNPNGYATTWHFEYGTTTNYGTSVPASPANLSAGNSPQSVSFPLTGLTPNTAYHFRLSATNANGTTDGSDVMFTTNNNLSGWRLQHFGTSDNTGTAANTADPDFDGVSNLQEYAYGMNPNVSSVKDRERLPLPSYNGSTMIASFVSPAGVHDILYGAQVSPTLGPFWSDIADTGAGNLHSFSSPVSGSGENFMRLTVKVIP